MEANLGAVAGSVGIKEALPQAPLGPDAIGGKTFAEILRGTDMHQQILQWEQGLKVGKEFSARELLLYQIQVGRFGLGVELMSKVGESLTTSIRRLQQGQ